jgi:hypothetical protein
MDKASVQRAKRPRPDRALVEVKKRGIEPLQRCCAERRSASSSRFFSESQASNTARPARIRAFRILEACIHRACIHTAAAEFCSLPYLRLIAMAGSWQVALQMQQTELQEIRAGIAFLRARERTCIAKLQLLRQQVDRGASPASSPQRTGQAEPLRDPRRRKARKSRGRPQLLKDGLALVEREESAAQRQDLSGMDLPQLLQAYAVSNGLEARRDLRVLAAKIFIQDVTQMNGGSKVLEFQEEVRRLSESMALDPKERVDLKSAFTKAAKERVREIVQTASPEPSGA